MGLIAQDRTAPRKLRPLFREGGKWSGGGGRLRHNHQPESRNHPRPRRADDLAQPSPDAISHDCISDSATRHDPDPLPRLRVIFQNAEQHRAPMHRPALGSHPRKLRGPRETGRLWKSQARLPTLRSGGVAGRWRLRAQASVWRAK